jgi:hypothetical protein
VGRTGNITPVMEVDPVSLSGATIRRVTAHHAGNIRNSANIGIGTRIEIIRSGEVIPKLESVLEVERRRPRPGKLSRLQRTAGLANDFLMCTNNACQAQIEQRISHWFRFWEMPTGSASRPSASSSKTAMISSKPFYRLDEADFNDMGFRAGAIPKSGRSHHRQPHQTGRGLAIFGCFRHRRSGHRRQPQTAGPLPLEGCGAESGIESLRSKASAKNQPAVS